MIRSELVKKVTDDNPGITLVEANRIVAILFDELIVQLAAGGRIELCGFGMFSSRARNARIGRNPRTGEAVAVEAKHVVYFKPGKEMQERLNI